MDSEHLKKNALQTQKYCRVFSLTVQFLLSINLRNRYNYMYVGLYVYEKANVGIWKEGRREVVP